MRVALLLTLTFSLVFSAQFSWTAELSNANCDDFEGGNGKRGGALPVCSDQSLWMPTTVGFFNENMNTGYLLAVFSLSSSERVDVSSLRLWIDVSFNGVSLSFKHPVRGDLFAMSATSGNQEYLFPEGSLTAEDLFNNELSVGMRFILSPGGNAFIQNITVSSVQLNGFFEETSFAETSSSDETPLSDERTEERSRRSLVPLIGGVVGSVVGVILVGVVIAVVVFFRKNRAPPSSSSSSLPSTQPKGGPTELPMTEIDPTPSPASNYGNFPQQNYGNFSPPSDSLGPTYGNISSPNDSYGNISSPPKVSQSKENLPYANFPPQ